MSAIRIAPERVERFAVAALRSTGVAATHAQEVARCLLNADLWGVDSHGMSRLPIYVERLQRGIVNKAPAMKVSGAMAAGTVDGDNGPGAVVGTFAMREAIARACKFGVSALVARRSNHYGVSAHYTRMAVEADCIGISGSNAPITMAAWGASEPTLGTNPFAVAMTAGKYGTFSLDMASSVVAKGKILVAQRKGTPIPEGWALDSEGRATTNADAAWNGVVLPFAGAKGSGFALFVEAIAGALAGAAMAASISDQYTDFEKPQDAGHFFIALHIPAFMPVAQFRQRMEALVGEVKARRRAQGFDEILMPGEIEARHEARYREQGIPLDPTLIAKLDAIATACGIAPLATSQPLETTP